MKNKIRQIIVENINEDATNAGEVADKILSLFAVGCCREEFPHHECKFYVNSDWTKLRCECGKTQLPKN